MKPSFKVEEEAAHWSTLLLLIDLLMWRSLMLLFLEFPVH